MIIKELTWDDITPSKVAIEENEKRLEIIKKQVDSGLVSYSPGK